MFAKGTVTEINKVLSTVRDLFVFDSCVRKCIKYYLLQALRGKRLISRVTDSELKKFSNSIRNCHRISRSFRDENDETRRIPADKHR